MNTVAMETRASASMRDLVGLEVDQVAGGWLNFAVGGAIGAMGYGAVVAFTDATWSNAAFAGSVAGGAVTSGFSALTGAGAAGTLYWGGVGAMTGGAVNAAGEYGNW